jgi:hypothetical protein
MFFHIFSTDVDFFAPTPARSLLPDLISGVQAGTHESRSLANRVGLFFAATGRGGKFRFATEVEDLF